MNLSTRNCKGEGKLSSLFFICYGKAGPLRTCLLAMMFMLPMLITAQTYTFTNAGATGRTGPTQTQLNSAYSGTNLQGAVTSKSGIQEWIVPASGPYKIMVAGAQGAPASATTGGRGAIMEGEFFLTAGDTLHILVGQKGEFISTRQYTSSPGGGGTFVVYPNGTSLIIAGGGGGTGNQRPSDADASTGTSGNSSSTANTGGSNGNGGTTGTTAAGAGGGLLTNGAGSGGFAYVNGGLGGVTNATYAPQGGGFGGGGSVTGGANSRYAGGGGYSGGGGSASLAGATTGLWGGGGGSYNSGIKQNNLAGANYDHGYVIIELATRTGNNAGVLSIDSPTVFCSGPQKIVATIANYGINPITSVKVNWSAGGTLQTPVTYTGTLDTAGGSGAATAQIMLGTYSFGGQKRAIKVWTSDPNGVQDTTPANDTASTILGPSMNGVYTIGGSGADYAKISDAINDMLNVGLCDSVRFMVAAGTYTERVVVPEIPGASATNTIKFVGAYKATTIITNAGSSTANWQTILMDGADYITFENFTVRGTGASYGIGIMLTNQANNNTFRNIDVEVSTTSTSTNFEGIVGSGSATAYSTAGTPGEFNTFEDINVSGGYYGVFYTGVSTSSTIEGSTFRNINVDGHYYYGINVQYLNNPIVDNCRVTTGRTTSSYGMRVYYCLGPIVTNNIAQGGAYGIYYYYNNVNNYKGIRGKFINNMFIGGTSYGVYGYGSDYTDYYHNSVLATNGTAGFVGSLGDNIDVRNNLFANMTSNSANEVVMFASSTFLNNNLDYNVYYGPNGANLVDRGTIYATLADWQAAESNLNENSLEQDPGFNSNSDLHLSNSGPKPYGPNLGLLTDVDGDARCEFAPSIGADESFIGKGTIKVQAGVFGPSNVYVNSPAVFEGKVVQGALQKNLWYLDGVFMKDTIDYVHTFTTTGTHTLRVVSIGCGSSDTADYNFTVGTQTAAPVADFAMETMIAQGDVLRFLDLSTNGPIQWKWEVSPDIYYDDNNQQQPRYKYMSGADTTHNPAIRFDQTGRYKVCLTVTNSFGNDQVCRTDYITVMPRVNIGSVNSVIAGQGYIYDDGGRDGNYTNGQLKGLLIQPCAEEVYLVFRDFKLECQDDYVRIYDGADNTAPALHPCTNNIGNGGGPGLTGPGCALACAPTMNDTFVAKSGKMYIEFYSSASGTARGFEAYWWNKPANVPAPVADFEAPDSICAGTLYTFFNKSQGQKVQVRWDLDEDMNVFESRDTVSTDWAFVIPGTAKIKLIAENCGGSDTIVKEIKVYTPAAPNVSFVADNLNPTTTDDVTFSSTIMDCVDKYKWTFTKVHGSGLYTQLDGTTDAQAVTRVMFHDTGLWTVELWAENTTGNNTLVKTGYIKVKLPYCSPTVGTSVSDVGISKVVFNTISNTTAQGQTAYSNYVSTHKTTIEIGATYDLEVSRTSNVNNISWAAWIDWNQDGDFEDFGEKVGSETNSNGKVWINPVSVPVLAKEGPTVLRVGVSRGAGANTPCGQNSYGEFEDYRVIVSIDRTLPVITLMGDAEMIIEQGRKYVEPGFNAEDNLDGTITTDVEADTVIVATNQITTSLNTFVVRDYEIRYWVKDAAGNTGTAIRLVKVIADTTAPMLTIAPDLSLSVDVAAGTYATPAVTQAEDNIDGDFTTQVVKVTTIDPQMPDVVQVIDPVDPTKVGVYTVTYYAVDMLGNAVTITRMVEIYDDVLPTLTLIGANPIEHQIGEPYTDAGVTTGDNYYSQAELDALVTSSNNVNVNKFGTYSYTYSLTDPSGNGPFTVTRQVIVTDTIEPVIELVGMASMTADVNEPFIDQGVKVSDNYGLKGAWTAGGSFYNTFPDGTPVYVGVYTITYSVEDLAGNVVTIDRTVEVVDRKAPQVSLIGASTVNICRWVTYNDSGITATDNYDETTELTVVTEGNWENDGLVTGLPGTYSIRYKVTDSSGNVAYSPVRTVNVLHESDFRCKGNGIDEKELESNITLYPNPNTGSFTVKANLPEMKQVRMSILNVMGQELMVVAEGMVQNGTYTVDLSGQAAGVYFLRVVSDNHTFTKQVIIAK